MTVLILYISTVFLGVKIMFRKLKKILYRSMESEEISYEKLQEILKKDSNVVLLDVRSKQEFEEGHLTRCNKYPFI